MFSFFNSSETQGNSTNPINEQNIFWPIGAVLTATAGMGFCLWSAINSKKENALEQQTITMLQETLGSLRERYRLQEQMNHLSEELHWALTNEPSEAQNILQNIKSVEKELNGLSLRICEDNSSSDRAELYTLIAHETDKLQKLLTTASEHSKRNADLLQKQEYEINDHMRPK
jgi:hypothetical protein